MFGTKAESLKRLTPLLKKASILPLFRITADEWKNRREEMLHNFFSLDWSRKKLIVRSSALAEDGEGESLAGRFTSFLDVRGKEALIQAIDDVFLSFGPFREENQIFIQPMLTKVKLSGVAFTRVPSSGAPYYVINYDDESGRTDTVTSGETNHLKTFYCSRSFLPEKEREMLRIILLLRELEGIFRSDRLDVEFAVTQEEELFLFQVRPLVFSKKIVDPFEKQYDNYLRLIADTVEQKRKRHPYLYGETTIYGVMPDWNPAEIIGVRPKPLALSLYKELVTDHVWAYQRDNYGYRNLRSFPLLMDFLGHPYIDVRVSFNSFLPKTLSPSLAEKLLNYYLRKLETKPDFHDKVEFQILFSCFAFDTPEKIVLLKESGFSSDECEELQKSLQILTNDIIDPNTGLWKKDIEKINLLEERHRIIASGSLGPIEKIYWLMEDCKRYGTLPFAGLARAGFIAIQMLRSLVDTGILNHDEYLLFLHSLHTVSSELSEYEYGNQKEAFLEKFGHLRPGTYDILSKRYDEDPDGYFCNEAKNIPSGSKKFVISLKQLKEIENFLRKNEIRHTAISLFDFFKIAIEGREYAKFIFTKNISDCLKIIEEWGTGYGYNRDDCAYLDIKDILKLYSSCNDHSSFIASTIKHGKMNYRLSEMLYLPPLIFKKEDVFAFQLPPTEPTFITLKRIKAKTADIKDESLAGKILFIPSADPGFDWIFSKNIAGFVTMYGGSNSHMAIRAAEQDLPAVIGVGENLFHLRKKNVIIEIDCANRQIFKIQ